MLEISSKQFSPNRSPPHVYKKLNENDKFGAGCICKSTDLRESRPIWVMIQERADYLQPGEWDVICCKTADASTAVQNTPRHQLFAGPAAIRCPEMELIFR
jgi:hypothetical protein